MDRLSASVMRTVIYDTNYRLCRHKTSEFGDEVFVYYNEDQLTQSGFGVAFRPRSG